MSGSRPRGLAPRGALLTLGNQQPDLGPSLNKKTDVWAYRVQRYWEEAVSRQWNVSTDVPWQDLDKYEISDELEIAFCQLCTLLSEVEMIATDDRIDFSRLVQAKSSEADLVILGFTRERLAQKGPDLLLRHADLNEVLWVSATEIVAME